MPARHAPLSVGERLDQTIIAHSVLIPDKAKTRQIVRQILSLPAFSPLRATAEELALFGKVCAVMTAKNRKWLSTAQATLPSDNAASLVMPAQKLVSRLVVRPGSREHNRYLEDHNELVYWLNECLPAHEKERYSCLLALTNTSQELGISHLPNAVDASAWGIAVWYQDYFYRAERAFGGEPNAQPGESRDDYYLRITQEKLDALLPQLKSLPDWPDVATGAADNSSLFARLLIHVALNRFIQNESDMDRLARTSQALQTPFVQTLLDAGHTSIERIVRDHKTSSGLDYPAMASHVLAPSFKTARTTLSQALARNIGRQVEAIIESCFIPEFAGDTISTNLLRNKEKTRAVAWLLLVWADATEAEADNEHPDVHKKKVRLVSQRSSIQTYGEGMMLRRRLISSLVVRAQDSTLSLPLLAMQHRYASAIRLAFRENLIATFKPATLAQWEHIFAMLFIERLETNPRPSPTPM